MEKDVIVSLDHCSMSKTLRHPLCWTLDKVYKCDHVALAFAAGGAPPLSLSSHVWVHQTWIQHDPYVLSSTPYALSSGDACPSLEGKPNHPKAFWAWLQAQALQQESAGGDQEKDGGHDEKRLPFHEED